MRKPSHLYLCLLFMVTALLAAKQFLVGGYYCVILLDDTRVYVGWARQFLQGLGEGVFYPRWLPDECNGYGSPTFLLYPPLFFYATAAMAELTGSLLVGMNLVRWLSLFLTVAGVFCLLREIFTTRSAFMAALCYLLFPLTILQQYICGSFAATVSTVWYAPLLLQLLRHHRGRKASPLIWGGLCYGGLLLTHLINAYMFVLVMAALLLALALVARRPAELWALPVVVGLGALVSAAYLLPVAFERSHLQVSAFVTQGPGFLYSYFFFYPNRLHLIPPHVIKFWQGFHRMYLVYELLLVAVLACSLLRLVRSRARQLSTEKAASLTAAFLAVALLTMYPTVGASEWMWRSIPFFNYIQFPYRWVPLTALLCTPAAAWLWAKQEEALPAANFVKAATVTVLAMAAVDLCYIWEARGVTEAELSAQTSPSPREHMPAGAAVAGLLSSGKAEVTAGRGSASVVRWQSTRREVAVIADGAVTIRLRTFYFPGWRSYLDGSPAAVGIEPGSGALLAQVPPGRHRLELVFEDTPARKLGKALSLASLPALAVLLLIFRRPR
ncbi:6-pyruvoyl-tetrahydropterin synthase-related protein [Geomonas sp.]|uniref:6-pyruvoyl-tetrahydropterin synthase-related protein n=1 Tax=Geomonas sp. TaxID=2651584 RepID=UPI002B479415|nr:6-pyruvoyl-tetrahydropterin synthase-related protein [Geomonas sp.]HJV34989.1 6-pyruvoyl-tetrahydropterin synthase-related protein [Geomonas sp.]